MRAPLFGALHALAVDDGGAGARVSLLLFAASDIQHMVNAFQRSVVTPQIEVTMKGAFGRQVLGT